MQKLGAGNFDHVRPCPKCTQSLKNKISRTMIDFALKALN